MVRRLKNQLSSHSAKERAQAAEELGHLGEKAIPCIPDLIKTLKDPDGGVRAKAIIALGFLEATEAVLPMIDALEDQDEMVRSSAVAALSFLKDQRAVQPLLQLLGDKNNELRDRVLRALGRIGDLAAVKPLIHALKDPIPFVRWGAAVGLGFLNSPEAVEPLISCALYDEDCNMRWRAVEALGNIGDQRSVSSLLEITENMYEDFEVRSAAEVALRKILDFEDT